MVWNGKYNLERFTHLLGVWDLEISPLLLPTVYFWLSLCIILAVTREERGTCFKAFFFFAFYRTVENGKETVEEWEDNKLRRRLVDGTLQLTN